MRQWLVNHTVACKSHSVGGSKMFASLLFVTYKLASNCYLETESLGIAPQSHFFFEEVAILAFKSLYRLRD